MSPVGIILVVGFVAVFVVCLYVDKNASKKFENEIREKYQALDSFENISVTAKGELLYYLPSGTLVGYKKWNLQDIAYVKLSCGKVSGVRVYYFSLADADEKILSGEYLTPSKKKLLKEKAYSSFMVGSQDKANQYVDFIKKHGSHIQYLSAGEVKE